MSSTMPCRSLGASSDSPVCFDRTLYVDWNRDDGVGLPPGRRCSE